jgi:CHRD domain
MRRLTLVFVVVLGSALGLAALSLASAKKTVWTAALSSGQEVPKQVVRNTVAHGLFKGTLSGGKLKWRLTFAKLTGPATQAHIHVARKGKAGAVLIPLCAPCTSGMTGTGTISTVALNDFKKHLLYVNVHTAKNPNGEIRGQLARG